MGEVGGSAIDAGGKNSNSAEISMQDVLVIKAELWDSVSLWMALVRKYIH